MIKQRTADELENIKKSWSMTGDGVLVWKRNANAGKKIGDPVGLSLKKSGHYNCFLSTNQKVYGYSLAQVAWFLYHGEWAGLEIDHIDGNPKNNKKENLRLATRSEQCMNRISGKAGRKYKGVYLDKRTGNFVAQIWINKVCKHLGVYKSQDEAAEVRALAAEMLHGDFANNKSYGLISA